MKKSEKNIKNVLVDVAFFYDVFYNSYVYTVRKKIPEGNVHIEKPIDAAKSRSASAQYIYAPMGRASG